MLLKQFPPPDVLRTDPQVIDLVLAGCRTVGDRGSSDVDNQYTKPSNGLANSRFRGLLLRINNLPSDETPHFGAEHLCLGAPVQLLGAPEVSMRRSERVRTSQLARAFVLGAGGAACPRRYRSLG
jgi:hypothetical protein